MNVEEKYLETNRNYIREKIFTDNEEREKEKEIEEEKFSKNFAFNLEYQKIINTQNNQNKITSELNKLIKFIRESYYYRDINGNRIKPKGELLPTPFQKLEKMNEDIKNYYENKISRKKSSLIIKNYRNKPCNNLEILNSLNNDNKRKIRNYLYLSKRQNLNNNKLLKNKSFGKNIHLLVNNNAKQKIIKNKSVNKDGKVCLSENFNKRRKQFFSDLEFNQINFWKAKLLYPQGLNSKNESENLCAKSSRYESYKSENKKIKNENKLINTMPNINKKNENFNTIRTLSNDLYLNKNKDFSKDLKKYNLIQFNMNQLIKPYKDFQDKIVINMRKTYNNIKNKYMTENKTINVNMDNDKYFNH